MMEQLGDVRHDGVHTVAEDDKLYVTQEGWPSLHDNVSPKVTRNVRTFVVDGNPGSTTQALIPEPYRHNE